MRLSFGNILGTEMEVPDMYTCQELCQVHMCFGFIKWEQRWMFQICTLARSFVRYTSEVKLWEHSGNRDGGSRCVHLPGAVSITQVRSRNRDAGSRYVHCQELCQVHK